MKITRNIAIISFIILAIPLTVFLALQRQNIRQKAAVNIQHYEYTFPDGNIYVYDMDNGHALVKQMSIPTQAGVRGVVANTKNHMLYISYGGDGSSNGNGSMLAYDLLTDKIVWQKNYPHGIDSMSITPDGSKIYMPSGELASNGTWYIVDPATGNDMGSITSTAIGPHNTIVSLNGKHVYLGGRNHNELEVVDTSTNQVIQKIGPLSGGTQGSGVRPFTINSTETLAYIAITGYLGFAVGDITTGKILYTVPIQGFTANLQNPSECPSHGISLSPDDKELYVIDWANDYVHVYDVSNVPVSAPKKVADIKLTKTHHNETPCAYDCMGDGWLQHSRDGRFVYVGDYGDVIDTATRKPIANIATLYNTRKMIEVDWQNGIPIYGAINRASVGFGSTVLSVSPTLTPSSSLTMTPTLTIVPTTSIIPSPSITNQPTSTPTVTPRPTPTPTLAPSVTGFSLSLFLHGIGYGGDNVHQNSIGNLQPVHTQRNVTVTVLDTNNQIVSVKQGTVLYNPAQGNFTGTINMGTLSSGNYNVKIRTAGFLTGLVTGIPTIVAGHLNTLLPVYLVNGDINNDNQLDITDYNMLVACFDTKYTTPACLAPNLSQSPGADLDDDGVVDGVDFNLFLSELNVQHGQ